MRRQIDKQVRLVCRSSASGSRRAVISRSCSAGIGLGEMGDERPIEPHEAFAVIKIGKGEPVLEDEIGHRDMNAARAAPSIFVRRSRCRDTL